ncbi:MAG: TRAP transporter fused permease subunit [Deltaproteobacteria bacterium]|nr:TRAP transporter fused permease subunit [Deltaproteobacteria bacterium]
MRSLSGWTNRFLAVWLVIIAAFQLYTSFTGIMEPRLQRGIHLLFLLPAAFILFPASKRSPKDRPTIADTVLAAAALIPPLYLIVNNDALNMRLEFVDRLTPVQQMLGALNIVLLIEAIRRAVVPAMAVLIATFIVYLFAAPYLPGIFYFKLHSVEQLFEMQYLTTSSGIYGSITGVSATFVALFVIFGAIMERTRTGEFFTNLARRIAGTSPGGPAKIAVISSGLFGSISGVAAANVYATGTFTIPMMKEMGYRPQFAGAVEAAASTGGMIMPPVMGAGAFVMSEITGISYLNIMVGAALGAIFYYVSVGMRVHFQALRRNLQGLKRDDRLRWMGVLKDSYLLVPLIALVILLFNGYSPFSAACAAIIVSFLLSFLRKQTRLTPAKIFSTLDASGRNMVMIALACAGADMVVSIVTNTGLALGIATVISSWSGGLMFPALMLIMVTSLLLGMGLPCTPAYIIAVTIGGPALQSLGVDLLAAHLFVFYFAILASVTPPVCIAAYCGAAIAGSKPLQTGFEAFRLALAGFVIPYIFIYNDTLLMRGSVLDIASLSIILLGAVTLLSAGMAGYLLRPLRTIERVLVIGAAFGLLILCAHRDIVTMLGVEAASVALMCLGVALVLFRRARRTGAAAARQSDR